jgi:hypothetical protein
MTRPGPPGTPRGYVDPNRPKTSWVRFVIEPEYRIRMSELARVDGISLSAICRRAIRQYLEERDS